ncbi:MAG TPA: cell division protein CrgA [Euzebya sp.]|nr:cell division protein CrgA [Euzebya sp.]
MPQSKSKRSSYTPPPKPKPPPSPRWVPVAGTALIALGIIVILVNYIFQSFLPGGNYWIIGGFVMMAGGLGILSQWR